MRVLVLFLLSAALSVDNDCGFRCWMSQLVLPVADVHDYKLGFDMYLTDIICYGVFFDQVETTFYEPVVLDVHVTELATYCLGNWSYKQRQIGHPTDHGTVEIFVNHSVFDSGLEVFLGHDKLPEYALVTHCDANVHVHPLHFHGGGLSGALLEAFSASVEKMMDAQLNTMGCNWFHEKVDENATSVIAATTELIRPYMHPRPPKPTPPPPDHVVHLKGQAMVGLVDYLFETLIGSNGAVGLNSFVDVLTNGTGEFHAPNGTTNFSFDVTVPGGSNVSVRLVEGNISGLDTWNQFEIHAVGNTTIEAAMVMRELEMHVIVEMTMHNDGPADNSTELAHLDIRLKNVSVDMDMEMWINQSHLLGLHPNELLDVGCLMDTLELLLFTRLQVNMTVLEFDVYPIDGDLERDLEEAIRHLMALATHSYGAGLPAIMNMFVEDVALDAANEFIEVILNNSECTTKPLPDEPPYDLVAATIALGIAGAGAIMLGSVQGAYMWKLRTAGTQLLMPLKGSAAALASLGWAGHKWTDSLMFSERLPWYVRFGIPVALLFNAGFLVAADFATDGGIYLLVNVGSTRIYLPSFFDVELLKSKTITVCSGVWPYVRILAMLVCWTIPAHLLSVSWRENLLVICDALGKWAFFEVYVFVLMMVATHFHLVSPAVPANGVPAGVTRVDVLMEARFGIYNFLIASVFSLLLTHAILAFHRHAAGRSWRWHLALDDRKRNVLCTQWYRIGNVRVRLTRFGQGLIAVLLASSIVLIGFGVTIDSFEFHMTGTASAILEYLGDQTDQDYSVVTLAESIPNTANNPNGFGIRSIQVFFYIATLAMPFTLLVALLILWLVPLAQSVQRKLYVVTEIVHAWSALEVFVIAILTALGRLREFGQNVIAQQCRAVDDVLRRFFNKQLEDDDVCFDVDASLDPGHYTLFVACVIYILITMMVLRLYHKVLQERSERAAQPGGLTDETTAIKPMDRALLSGSSREDTRLGPMTRRILAGMYLITVDDTTPMTPLKV